MSIRAYYGIVSFIHFTNLVRHVRIATALFHVANYHSRIQCFVFGYIVGDQPSTSSPTASSIRCSITYAEAVNKVETEKARKRAKRCLGLRERGC